MKENIEEALKKMMSVSISILREWKEYKIITPVENPQAIFTCTDCGKCCSFEGQFCWIYPSDLLAWAEQVKNDEFVHLLFGTTFELLDSQGMTGLGLPSQKAISEIFLSFFDDLFVQEEYKRVCQTILSILKKINKSFDEESDHCVFFDAKASKHCLIYPYRPLQCRAYPFDASYFVNIKIPKDLEANYPLIGEANALPFCPPEAYSSDPRKGVIISEKELDLVLLEKATSIASIKTQVEIKELDIQMLLLMEHHEAILKLKEKI